MLGAYSMSVLAATLFAVAVADAVQWRAPAGCPEADAVRRRVTDLLGRTPTEQELHAEGIVHAGPPWRLDLSTTIGGRHQQRALEGDDCATVTEAAALILAVSLDPLGVSQNPEVAGPPARVEVPVLVAGQRAQATSEPQASTDANTGPLEGPSSPPTSPTPARRQPWLRLGLGGELGAVPRGTGGVRLGIALAGPRLFVRVDGGYWIDRMAVLHQQPALSGARIGLGTISLAAGLRLGGARVGVPISIGLEAGGLRTRGVGLLRPQALTFPWLAGLVGVGVSVGLARRLALWGAIEGSVPIVRPSVRVGQGTESLELYRTAPLGGRVLLGLAVRLGRP